MEIQSEIGNINYTLDYKQSLFAQSDPRIHLGLGKLNSNVNVKISWPDGRIVQFTNIAINHYYQINKSAGQISKIEYPVETSSGKIVDLSTNASQQDINRLLTFAFLVTDKQVLKTLWSKANAENKIQLLNQIAQSTYLSNQTWLFHALQESDERLGLAALGIFKQKEWDHSVVYLLPLFEHENTQVVCALADMFAFFLDEEEVVLERKGLAVAPIMKSLKTADNQKKICLLKALAASENKRAVLSVIDTLKQSNNPEVLSIAIATLGLIRDARAKDEIKSVLETTQSPQVISATLVALQRLDDQDIATIFNQTFMSKPSEAKLIRQLETINLLLTDSEGVVISRSLVISALNELKNFIDDFDASPSLLDSLLKTVGNTNDRRFQTIAERYLAQKNTQIQAAITLIKIGDSTAKHKAADILLRLNTPDLLIMLRLLDKQNVYLSLDSINVLANRSIQNKSLVENILDLGAKIGRENYQRWLIEVLKRTDDVKTVQLAINYAIRFEVTGQINLQDMPWGKSPEAIAAYLKWQYRQSSSYSENQRLKLRLLLNRILRDKQLSIQERQSLLIIAAKQDPFIVNNFLFDNNIGITQQQIAAILIELPPLQQTKEQITLFEQILNNQSLPKLERLVAAVGLLSTHPEMKQEILAKL